jgi:hypothetical protein
MPKAISIPKYRLHKGSGQALVQIGGRRHYLGKYRTPQSEEKYGRIIAELTANPHHAPAIVERSAPGDPLTVVQVCAAYPDFAVGYYQREGKATGSMPRVKACRRVLRRLYGATSAIEFGPLKLQAIQRHLADKGKSRRYVNHLTQAIRRVFKAPVVALHFVRYGSAATTHRGPAGGSLPYPADRRGPERPGVDLPLSNPSGG